MNYRLSAVYLIVIIFVSCVGQNNTLFIPEPDFSIYNESEKIIEISNIIETKDGAGIRGLPNWLLSYIEGGIEAVERLDSYRDKYVFISVNEGDNFTALNKWIENFSPAHDFPILAAARIDKRIISSASLYPDNEYGMFYEAIIKNAYSSEYPGAVKEDTYWMKVWFERENTWEYTENYKFFVLITINKTAMQNIIRNMFSRSIGTVSVTVNQNNSINRLRQTFFERF